MLLNVKYGPLTNFCTGGCSLSEHEFIVLRSFGFPKAQSYCLLLPALAECKKIQWCKKIQ